MVPRSRFIRRVPHNPPLTSDSISTRLCPAQPRSDVRHRPQTNRRASHGDWPGLDYWKRSKLRWLRQAGALILMLIIGITLYPYKSSYARVPASAESESIGDSPFGAVFGVIAVLNPPHHEKRVISQASTLFDGSKGGW